jgi:ribosome assembly protein SQT1|tara:strand:- start:3688 stop:4767 length:1080 start_codon:yes stop_codon:yes gene_type:complete
MDPPTSIRAAMGDDHEGDDDMEPVFIDEGDCEVALDLDEEDDAPMDSDDEIEGDPNAPIEDRDAEGTELVPPSEDAAAVVRAHRGSVYACAWSPTAADTFATGGGDDLAYLHRIAPDCAVTSTPLKAHTDTIASMAFNHDGSLLATGGLEGKASIWNVSTGELVKTLEGPGGGLEWVRWHPKGNVLLAGSEDFTAWMWNAENAELMQVFAGHSNSVLCGGFSPDGRHVVTGSCDGSLRIWAPRSGECSTLFQGHPFHDGPVTCIDFHASTPGLMLTGSEDNTCRLVSGESGKVLGTLAAHTETVECVGLSADFPFAASGAIDTKCVVWDLNTLQPRTTMMHDKAVSALKWVPGTACVYR